MHAPWEASFLIIAWRGVCPSIDGQTQRHAVFIRTALRLRSWFEQFDLWFSVRRGSRDDVRRIGVWFRPVGCEDRLGGFIPDLLHLDVQLRAFLFVQGHHGLLVQFVVLLVAPRLRVPHPHLIAGEPHGGPGRIRLHGVTADHEFVVLHRLFAEAAGPVGAGVHRV